MFRLLCCCVLLSTVFISVVSVVVDDNGPHHHRTYGGKDGAPKKRLPWPYPHSALFPGEALIAGGAPLESSTARLELHKNATLRLMRKADNAVLWSAGPAATMMDACAANMTFSSSGDGLYMYACDGKTVLWNATVPSASIAVLEDSCNFTMYKALPTDTIVWGTNSSKCLEIHIVPHSHDDVGWLLNPDEYYTGCEKSNDKKYHGVRSIITTVVDALLSNPTYKFSQVEMYYFNRWWLEQNTTRKALVRGLVERGQLQFIGGGWSMHDEGCVHHVSVINNMAMGAQELVNATKLLGDAPLLKSNLNIGWQIDPFGHASATPRLMSQMGFNALLFARMDYEQRAAWMKTKMFENIWRSSPRLGKTVDLFMSLIYDGYCGGCIDDGFPACPTSFCCMTCSDDDVYIPKTKTSATSATERIFTITALAELYILYIRNRAVNFRSNHVLVPWGCDFNFENAATNFQLMDSLMAEINGNYKKYGMALFYSTPHEYISTLNRLNYAWPVNTDDYFLDSDNEYAYWSGYLSSRPAFKGYERRLMSDLNALDKLDTENKLSDAIRVLREALGVVQHHDSITGTEREAVRNNYQLLMSNGTHAVDDALKTHLRRSRCNLMNISICAATLGLSAGNGASVVVEIFNPRAHAIASMILSVPIPVPHVTVTSRPSQSVLRSQVVTAWELQLTEDRTSPTSGETRQPFELHFEVSLPALGSTMVEITTTASSDSSNEFDDGNSISNEHLIVSVDPDTGLLDSITLKATGMTRKVQQNIFTYCPSAGNNASGQASGAYIFRTCEPDEKPVPLTTRTKNVTIIRGSLFSEIRQNFGVEDRVHQTIRLYNSNNSALSRNVHLLTGIGEINITSGVGKEVVMKFDTDVASNDTWYQDSQGLEVQQRKRNSRPNFPYTPTELVAGNYYPSNVFTFLTDNNNNNNNNNN
eukprot:PhM_4_TR5922/c0_g1_i1/m.11492/K12311/MAN2B1, LAMAN; lysosomal alpha-mannosidase